MPRRKDDILLKSAFEETFPDLLRFYFADADVLFDMERGFAFLDKELGELFPELEKAGGNRFVDMLVKVFLRNGTEEWILLHIEIQGGSTKKFPHRMLQYWYRIYDRYGVNISALAVFTGDKNQQRPDCFHKSFLGTEITYKYNVCHILDHTEAALLAMDNPFAFVVLAAQKVLLAGKVPEEELARQRFAIARAFIESKRYSRDRIVRFLYFLKNFIYIENQEINRNFDRQTDKLIGKKHTMGIIEAIKFIEREAAAEEAEARKNHEVVKNLLRHTDFGRSKIAMLAGVTESFVRKVRREMSAERQSAPRKA